MVCGIFSSFWALTGSDSQQLPPARGAHTWSFQLSRKRFFATENLRDAMAGILEEPHSESGQLRNRSRPRLQTKCGPEATRIAVMFVSKGLHAVLGEESRGVLSAVGTRTPLERTPGQKDTHWDAHSPGVSQTALPRYTDTRQQVAPGSPYPGRVQGGFGIMSTSIPSLAQGMSLPLVSPPRIFLIPSLRRGWGAML